MFQWKHGTLGWTQGCSDPPSEIVVSLIISYLFNLTVTKAAERIRPHLQSKLNSDLTVYHVIWIARVWFNEDWINGVEVIYPQGDTLKGLLYTSRNPS